MVQVPSRIRIINVPTGDAPLDIRKAWIGCEFDLVPRTCADVPELVRSVVRGEISKKSGFDALQMVALDALKAKSQAAYDWWRAYGFPQASLAQFRFNTECAEVIGTTEAEGSVKRADDMETGTTRISR